MNWINTKDALPQVDDFMNRYRTNFEGRSIRVLTFSEKGAHWGRYWHNDGIWEVENFAYDPGVTHWVEVTPPQPEAR